MVTNPNPNPNPNPIKSLSNLLRRLGDHYGIFIPTATQLRKHTSRAGALRGSDYQRTLLSKQMSHSLDTHKRYYETVGTSKDAAEAYHAAKEVRKTTEKEVKQPRKSYSMREVDTIQKYFRKEISEGKSVTLKECRTFLERNLSIQGRTAKNIQDKVRNL